MKCSDLDAQRFSPAARSNLEGTARSKSVDLTKGIELFREFSEGLLDDHILVCEKEIAEEESSRKEESPKVNS